MRSRDTVRLLLALSAAAAGSVHLALAPDHLAEWRPLGAGFLALGGLQLVAAALLARRERRGVLLGLAALSLGAVAVWAVSRTTGLPVGPHAGVPEPVGRADLVCCLLELPGAVGALLLLRRPGAGRAPAGTLARLASAVVALTVLGGTSAAIADPGHTHAHPPAAPAASGADDPATEAVETGVDANGNGADDGVEAYYAKLLTDAHAGHEGYAPPAPASGHPHPPGTAPHGH